MVFSVKAKNMKQFREQQIVRHLTFDYGYPITDPRCFVHPVNMLSCTLYAFLCAN
jgi:hypothetical protein